MTKKIELLAPAGSLESLKAAVECGADAVYLGMTSFNARLKSENFEKDDFERAADYAHSKDVFVYLTLNTLVRNDELNLVMETARKAANFGVDAFIVQDVGLVSLLKKHFPDVRIHASTQMTICDPYGVKFAQEMGIKRVVLARELSISEISEISEIAKCPNSSNVSNSSKCSNVELEVFIHGSLCICYSGQCLMSSMLGGRSGNRGLCAQPCRLPYKLFVDGKLISNNHLLSPKDLCGLGEIPELLRAGVSSLKIEGRLKSTEYVAATTSIYRKYLDLALEESGNYNIKSEDLETLMQVFNRGGFSSGWLKRGSSIGANQGKSQGMMSVEKPKNWGLPLGKTVSNSDFSQLAQVLLERSVEIGDGIEIWNGEENSPGGVVSILKKGNKHIKMTSAGEEISIGVVKGNFKAGCKVYKTSSKSLRERLLRKVSEKTRSVEISGKIEISLGKPTLLVVEDSRGNKVSVISETFGEASQKVVLTRERVGEQLKKTGDSPFVFRDENVDVKLEKEVYFPLSEISRLRREALEKLNTIRIKEYKRSYHEINEPARKSVQVKDKKISVFFYKDNFALTINNEKVSVVYLPVNVFENYSKSKDHENLEKHENLESSKVEVFAWLPAGTKGKAREDIDKKVEIAVNSGISGLLLGGVGDLKYVGLYPNLKYRLNHGFNIYNNLSVEKFKDLPCTVSPELETDEIADLSGEQLEALVYGDLTVMTSAQCFLNCREIGECEECEGYLRASRKSCIVDEKSCQIEDRRGRRFTIIKSPSGYGTIILGGEKFNVINSVSKMRNIESFRIEIYDETEDRINQIISKLEKAMEV